MWLIFCFVVLWTGFSEAYASITLTLFVPLTLAAFGIVLRGSSFAFRKTVFRTRDRRNFGAAFAISSVLVPVLLRGGRRRHRLGPGARRRRGRRSVDELGQPDVGARRRARRRRGRLPRRRLPRLGRPPAQRSDDGGVLPASRHRRLDRRRRGRRRRHLRAAIRRRVPVRRADDQGPAARGPLRACAASASLVLLVRDATHWARLLAIGAVASIVVGWGVAQWPYILPESLEVADAAAPSATLGALLVAAVGAVLIVVPGFVLLYTLDQKGLLPDEGVD